jgi:hypothetical protein
MAQRVDLGAGHRIDLDQALLGGPPGPDVRFGSIVLKKSFVAKTEKFSGPLVRLARLVVRDYIKYGKTDR